MMTVFNVSAVVGAGTMGHGIAQILALNGIKVYLIDQSEELLDQARGWISDNLNFMVELKELENSEIGPVMDRINFTIDLANNLPKAEYILEAVNEDLAVKCKIWKQLSDHASPNAILSSNTSSYDIDELAESAANPSRIIGTHWFHPPQITPCVEVIPSKAASKTNIDRVMEFLNELGKMPTLCKSRPGFVANRIQMALAAESIALVEEGLATPAEVDRIVKSSFGFRLGAYGPFEIIDQAGADTYLGVFQYLHEKLGENKFKPSNLLVEQVKNGRLGLKTSGGFYEYGSGAADAMRRDRDRKFYARLNLVRQESQQDK